MAAELEAAVLRVLRSGRYVLGAEVEAFEEEMAARLGVRHAVGVASGSDALLLALMALGVGPGDEVVTTPFSFFATAAAVVRLGATPVFADIDPRDYTIDPAEVARLSGARTRALLPVHLFGRCADLAALDAIARRHRIPIVEDAAQALDASRAGARVGRGDITCLSFYPTKNLGAAGDAGLVATDDDRVAGEVARLRVHGDAGGYRHVAVGINSRLDAIQAALLRVKLARLEARDEARRERARRYTALIAAAGLEAVLHPPRVAPGERHAFQQYVVRVPERERVRSHLRARGVATAVYYPIPLHLQPCFSALGYARGDLPEAERAAEEALALPLFPELTLEQQERIVAELAACIRAGAAPRA